VAIAAFESAYHSTDDSKDKKNSNISGDDVDEAPSVAMLPGVRMRWYHIDVVDLIEPSWLERTEIAVIVLAQRYNLPRRITMI
jgi:hypothetical protein